MEEAPEERRMPRATKQTVGSMHAIDAQLTSCFEVTLCLSHTHTPTSSGHLDYVTYFLSCYLPFVACFVPSFAGEQALSLQLRRLLPPNAEAAYAGEWRERDSSAVSSECFIYIQEITTVKSSSKEEIRTGVVKRVLGEGRTPAAAAAAATVAAAASELRVAVSLPRRSLAVVAAAAAVA